MRNQSSKEVMIFCDKETGTASIRIFKFRNYVWAGGKTFEVKKDSRTLGELFKVISSHVGENVDKSSILWDDSKEVATTYVLEMKSDKC